VDAAKPWGDIQAPGCPWITRASVNQDGTEGNKSTRKASIVGEEDARNANNDLLVVGRGGSVGARRAPAGAALLATLAPAVSAEQVPSRRAKPVPAAQPGLRGAGP
jgi:hypothetical protein